MLTVIERVLLPIHFDCDPLMRKSRVHLQRDALRLSSLSLIISMDGMMVLISFMGSSFPGDAPFLSSAQNQVNC